MGTDEKNQGWHGVDLDGTLAEYHGFTGVGGIGKVIEPMLARVKAWLADGEVVKIMTARAGDPNEIPEIEAWLEEQGIGDLEITNQKDYAMIDLWDDRVVQVVPNTGIPVTEIEDDKDSEEIHMNDEQIERAIDSVLGEGASSASTLRSVGDVFKGLGYRVSSMEKSAGATKAWVVPTKQPASFDTIVAKLRLKLPELDIQKVDNSSMGGSIQSELFEISIPDESEDPNELYIAVYAGLRADEYRLGLDV